MRVRPQEECRYPMQLARPPARNNRDLRSDGPETSYKLLCLRAVRGNLLATSSAGPSLRRNSSRKKPLYRSFALSLRTLCLAAPLRVLCFGYLGEAYLLRKVSSIGQVAKNEETEQAYSWLWVCSYMIASRRERGSCEALALLLGLSVAVDVGSETILSTIGECSKALGRGYWRLRILASLILALNNSYGASSWVPGTVPTLHEYLLVVSMPCTGEHHYPRQFAGPAR